MKNKPIRHLYSKARFGKILFFIFYAALLLLISYWNFQRDYFVTVWMIQALPLLAFLPGILQNYYRSYSWLCFALLLYFIFAILKVFASNSDILDILFLVLIICVFIASMMCSRWQQRIFLENKPIQ